MFDKLKAIVEEYGKLQESLVDPAVIGDRKKYVEVSTKHKQLQPIVEIYKEYEKLLNDLEGAQELAAEDESFAKEVAKLKERQVELDNAAMLELLPKDPNDFKNVIMEIRGAAGGDEANIFAGDLYRMYARFGEMNGWKLEILNSSVAETGGYKEIIFKIVGEGAYSRLKYESGVHRVQRVPATESSGRIHTSTATVLVMPEVEEMEVKIDEADLRVDTFRASGPGGQSVNTTDSAVRITHIPTGIVVSCQNQKSQQQNKASALIVLQSRLEKIKQDEESAKRGEERLSQIGTGERSEKIRTYNYLQDRITDHRIGQNFNNIMTILDGDINALVDAIATEEQSRLLATS